MYKLLTDLIGFSCENGDIFAIFSLIFYFFYLLFSGLTKINRIGTIELMRVERGIL